MAAEAVVAGATTVGGGDGGIRGGGGNQTTTPTFQTRKKRLPCGPWTARRPRHHEGSALPLPEQRSAPTRPWILGGRQASARVLRRPHRSPRMGVPTWASLIAQGSRRRWGAAVRHLSPCRLSGLVTVISHRQLAVSPPTDEKAIARDSSRREESTCRTAQGKDVHPVEGAACVNVCQQCPHRSCVREACARLPSWRQQRAHHNGTDFVVAMPQRVLCDTST